MADILSFRDDPHQDVEMLLPWYATGQLDGDDIAKVEAHLDRCGQCRATVERERRLKAAIGKLPVDADLGWQKLQARIAPKGRASPSRRRISRPRWRGMPWPVGLAAFAGAQTMLLLVALLLFRPVAPQPDYHMLGAASVRTGGNMLVMFSPDTTERTLRAILARADARIVDGPTAAGAYIVETEPERRDGMLVELRRQPHIVLAEPMDRRRAQ
ncbi:hypothetical protein DM806_01470 [Sphingobium lactosutens]|uniref:anti-sigma factor family protein n=1 Tax=Sphingobium lactosutens TaxID=522773 RepID=UPI0015BDB434|nr:zf-HC2 domain-containing protein [Sphingobium lactosutens]NWK94375.1 hypothetical protein [Sphingobium lactosutens]